MRIFFLLLLFAGIYMLSAQEITVRKTSMGKVYMQNNRFLKLSEVVRLMDNDPVARKWARTARTYYVASQILGGAGLFLAGWHIGASLTGTNPRWDLVVAGGIMLGMAVPLVIAANRKLKRAVERYNDRHRAASASRWTLEFTAGPASAGLRLRF
ncbi:MAG: hypothetical protein GXO27_07620 [Chlorobi bacterium]|nr:hypothetical protein [Chlorobiota bacterium]